MGLLNYMQKNKFSVYEYKRRIPKDLLPKFPKNKSGVIKFSLKTKNADEARKLTKLKDIETEQLFATLRGQKPLEINKPDATTHTIITNSNIAASGKFLNDLIPIWKSERKPDVRTIGAMQLAVSKFEEKHGKLDISLITKPHMLEYRNIVSLMSSGRTNISETVSTRTINKYLSNISVLLNIAVNQGFINHNVAVGFGLKKSTKEKQTKENPLMKKTYT